MSTKDYDIAVSANPVFNTILGLTNTTFDPSNVRSGYMATEAQIQELWQDIIRLEERIDYCCREIVFWDFQVRIRDKYGNIVSDYLENRTTGIMRRGKNFTMKLPIKAIPKYEVEQPGSYNGTTGTFTDCPVNGENSTVMANDLCSLLYRGTEGTYYNMSVRKTTQHLGIAGTANGDNTSVIAVYVDAAGQVGTYNYYNNYSPQVPKFPVNSHFAYTDNNDDIYIDVSVPVPDSAYIIGNNLGRPYGRVYKLDLRDVTLGS